MEYLRNVEVMISEMCFAWYFVRIVEEGGDIRRLDDIKSTDHFGQFRHKIKKSWSH